MKGIILAAGDGTRLYPATHPISKILLPIYDRPMIYCPLSLLMMAGIKDILIITNEKDSDNFKKTLGDGSQFGIRIEYMIQYVQRGISDAFIIAKEWIGNETVSLILGDNVLYGGDVETKLKEASKIKDGAIIFGHTVSDPERFGVIEYDGDHVISLEEKPSRPKSDCASIGVYFYDNKVSPIAETLKPSERGELEITDLNIEYLKRNELSLKIFDEKTVWIDAGTFDSLLAASTFIAKKEKEIGKKILCPELIAYQKGFISKEKILEWLDKNKKSDYYLSIIKEIND